jgi:hypothetical protein
MAMQKVRRSVGWKAEEGRKGKAGCDALVNGVLNRPERGKSRIRLHYCPYFFFFVLFCFAKLKSPRETSETK